MCRRSSRPTRADRRRRAGPRTPPTGGNRPAPTTTTGRTPAGPVAAPTGRRRNHPRTPGDRRARRTDPRHRRAGPHPGARLHRPASGRPVRPPPSPPSLRRWSVCGRRPRSSIDLPGRGRPRQIIPHPGRAPMPPRIPGRAGSAQQRGSQLRIVYAGTPEPAVPSLSALLASRHEVLAVITRPPAPRGRGRALRPSPVGALAAEAGLPVLTPRTAKDPEFADRLRDLRPDAAAVVAYGALLPPAILEIPTHGWVNLHFSLLPAWRGAAPVPAAIRAGDDITGATTFRLEAGMDTGPVYGLITEPIRADDTAGDLLARLAIEGSRLLVATLDGLADGAIQARPQPAEGVSYAGKVGVEDARVDWT